MKGVNKYLRMAEYTHVFQISGIKNPNKKRVIKQGILKLGGRYIGGSVYQHAISHLIIPQVLSSEKFLAACAAGKWVVTPEYVLDSVRNGSWLPEGPYEVAISTSTSSTFYPTRQWREKVASGMLTGAFQGWRVLLMVQEPARRAMFKRLLKAGRAKVYDCSPPTSASITHVMAKPITVDSKSHDAPCYPVSHIVQHLFGKSYLDMNFNIKDDETETEEGCFVADFFKFEKELKDCLIKQESQPRLHFIEFLGYHDPYRPQSQATETDFSQIGTMIECGLYIEALDSIRSGLFPGLLPPAPYLVSLLEYAQQGNATSVFLRNLQQVLHRLLVTNPPWVATKSLKKYFSKVFQCPRCKTGLWPFLKSTISYCLLREATCHPLSGPALPTLLHFHSDLLAFFLKLFQGELHAVTTGEYLRPNVSKVAQASESLVLGAFWTVWERSTLLSNAVKQLIQLLIQAALEDYSKQMEKQALHLPDTLLDLLCVVVEFWCHHNLKLNQTLVEKGLNDLAEHFAVISHNLSPDVLAELVAKVSSSRLKFVLTDSIFRNLYCRNGSTVGDEPLSLKKLFLHYVPALEVFSQFLSPCDTETESSIRRHHITDPGCRVESTSASVSESEKSQILKGLNRVNVAGETLLHRACKRNQVETVLQILALPDTDINIKDHAGWTPLHEACNHGSTACVEVLLRHRPAPVVNSQVGGVSPLHDALLNGHIQIAKMLLEHAGSDLLQQKDSNGRTPLDLVSEASQREELLNSARIRDTICKKKATEVLNLPLLEAGSCLLAHLIFSYQQEKGLSGFTQSSDMAHTLGLKIVRALKIHSFQKLTSGWTNQHAVRLLEDAKTLMDVGRGCYDEQVSQTIRECGGENTRFLMEILEDLKSRGKELVKQYATS